MFFVFALLIDTLIPLEIIRVLSSHWGYIIALLILAIFLYVEIKIYSSFWGKNGRLSLEKYKENR
jgi:YbbR domain-containing protein